MEKRLSKLGLLYDILFSIGLTDKQCLCRIFVTLARGPVAQLGARINRTDEVEGSNPSRSTGAMIGPIAQMGARLNGIEKVESSSLSGSTSEE